MVLRPVGAPGGTFSDCTFAFEPASLALPYVREANILSASHALTGLYSVAEASTGALSPEQAE